MAWTLLRPTGFMQNTLAWGPRVLDGTFYSPVPDAVVQHRRRARRRRGRRRRADRRGPRGQGVRAERPRGGLLPRPGAPRVRRRRARGHGRGDPGRDAQARARARRRPALERRGPVPSCSSSTRAAARRWSPPASRTRWSASRATSTTFASDHVEAFQEHDRRWSVGRRARDVLRRPRSSRSSIPSRSSARRGRAVARAERRGRRAARPAGRPAHRRPPRRAPGAGPDRDRGPAAAARGTADAYLRLHLLSHRLVKPHERQPRRHLRRAAERRLDERRPGRPGEPDRRCSCASAPTAMPLQVFVARQVPAHDRLRGAVRRARRRRRPRPARRVPGRGHDGHARGLRELQRRHARALDGRGPHQRRASSSATARTSAAARRSWARCPAAAAR